MPGRSTKCKTHDRTRDITSTLERLTRSRLTSFPLRTHFMCADHETRLPCSCYQSGGSGCLRHCGPRPNRACRLPQQTGHAHHPVRGRQRARRGGVLTWPDGNATLASALAKPSAERLHGGSRWTCCAMRRTRWSAGRPSAASSRYRSSSPRAWWSNPRSSCRRRQAMWAVANLHLSVPLQGRPGAAPAWDNMLYDLQDRVGRRTGEAAGGNLSGTGGGLGYVDARHQTLDPRPGPTVLTHYRALGDQPQRRQQLLSQPWRYWRDQTLAELSVAHPDLLSKVTRMDITRYGRAMSIPVPGTL